MSNYIIKQCEKNEISDLMNFFAVNWSVSHLISTNLEYVDYHYYNVRKDMYNFLIAKDIDNNEIIGLIGYIPNYHYDNSIKETFVFITNWLVKKSANGGVGLKLLNSIKKYEDTNNYGTINNNDMTIPMYKALKYKTGVLKQYVLINSSKSDFSILKGNHKSICKSFTTAVVKSISSTMELTISNELKKHIETTTPRKTIQYFENKYLKSPYYKYLLYAVMSDQNEAKALLVIKKVKVGNSSAYRIIDFLGEPDSLIGIHNFLNHLIEEENAEYIDFYCEGEFKAILEMEGFILNMGQNGLVVPNYFEKFLQENIISNYAYFTDKPFQIFRGDGDGDRPRILPRRE